MGTSGGMVWVWMVRAARWVSVRWSEIALYLVFVVVATLLWYLTKLSHDYTVDLPQAVILTHQPPGQLLEGSKQRTLLLRLEGRGYNLLKYKKLRYFFPLHLDLRENWGRFTMLRAGRGYLSRGQLAAILSRQLPNGVQLVEVLTDSLSCSFSTLARRHLPVRLAARYSTAPQYMQLGPPRILPDSVWVSGPEATVEAMQYVPTDSVPLGELFSPYRGMLSLSAREPGVEYSADQVAISIDVEQFTEKRFQVPLSVRGAPDSLSLSLLPTSVEVRCNVPLGAYDRVRASDFRAWVYFPEFSDRQELTVYLDSFPRAIFGVQLVPQRVKYIITQQNRGENFDSRRHFWPNREW